MLKVVVIGSGNVAQHLIAVFKEAKGVELVQVFARNPEKLTHLLEPQKVTDSADSIKEADIYIISVTDDAIAQVSSSLPFSGKLVVHTSGSVAMEQLDSKNRRGVFYPLQTFSKNKEVDFSIIPLCLESERNEDYHILEQLANQITKSVYNISSQQRKALHVAAVFVSNFANHMYAIGSDICQQNDIPFDILKPLILETADKILYLDPVKAQTGPAVRNDRQTIEKHLDFITDEKQKEIYKLITQSIQNVKKL
ncbi:DUF2520 domain-containing protein [Flavobacterium alkalisoli]|uniref:DUF2520 domain-containing protein n=1 Tax=Flavobacterium alkalisoli TaxID=2602769 RepID=A0A5B9FT71_9FLAO|nr:Rossmann-like and DUF2520 domain-containing protein [Flavobacterium alkalisoli]QEE50573.1 DUF2520 domain-containing protein [Flavobacterium alkalisoli]